MNSSWSISDDDVTRSISLTLSLLQSQLLLVTGVSRLSTTNSSLMKQMSELSLGSLYWQVTEAVVGAGCPGFSAWLELRPSSRSHPASRRTQHAPKPAAQDPSARAPGLPSQQGSQFCEDLDLGSRLHKQRWNNQIIFFLAKYFAWHSELETQVPVNLNQDVVTSDCQFVNLFPCYYPLDDPTQGLLGKIVTCRGLKSLAEALLTWSHLIRLEERKMLKICGKIILF